MNDYFYTVSGTLTMKVSAENENKAFEKASEYLTDNSPISNWEINGQVGKDTLDSIDISITA